MKLSPSLVAVKKIVSQVPITSFSEAAIAQAAKLILEVEGVINPILVKRTSLESYEVLDGDFEYYAAAKAREMNPRKGEMIGAFIVEEETENILREQVKHFRNNRVSNQSNSIEAIKETENNKQLEILLKKMEQLSEKLKDIESRDELQRATNKKLEILFEKIEEITESNKRIESLVAKPKSKEKVESKSPYNNMKVEDLKQLLKDKGVKFKSKITKAELIKLIEENR